MSDVHNDEHETLIKTPKQLIYAILAGFIVPILVIVLLVKYVASNDQAGAGSNSMSEEAIAARLQPVADVGFTLVDANAPRQLMAGDAVYKASCAACHDSGAAGAPKLGDAAGWTARLAAGQKTVVEHAINGLRAMPPKGGNPDLDDVEVERAVVFLVNQSGGKFKEPEVKQAAPEAAPEAAAAAAEPAVAAAPAPAAAPAEATPAVAKIDGKKVYDSACFACHTAGVAGAPKLGDKAAWAERIAQGNETLYKHSIAGFQGKTGFMPPRGGSSASDAEIQAAVDYMVAAVK